MSDLSELNWCGRKPARATINTIRLREMAERAETLVLDLAAESALLHLTAAAAREHGVDVWGWIEVGRDPAAAGAHPDWMHAPQHHEWLQAFPDYRAQGGRHPALVSDWICVNNRKAFDYALKRVQTLVQAAPPLDGVLLNDIQGPPAGCGCGNILCRSWDNSPGDKIAPTPYTNPDLFFSEVFWRACADALAGHPEKPLPRERVVPILCGECEIGIPMGAAFSPDGVLNNCRGIDCSNVCSLHYWPAMVRAFAPERGGPSAVGLLTPYKLFGRDLSLYGSTAAWVQASLTHYHSCEPTARLTAVIQGWEVTAEELEAQTAQAVAGHADGLLILEEPLDQSYHPLPLPPGYVPAVPPSLCGHTNGS